MRVVEHWHKLPREVDTPGTIQGQVGLGCEQSDPVEYVPAYCREGGL